MPAAAPSLERYGSKTSLVSSPGQAAKELRELLGSESDAQWPLDTSLLPERRPISAASTSAGTTPCPEEAAGRRWATPIAARSADAWLAGAPSPAGWSSLSASPLPCSAGSRGPELLPTDSHASSDVSPGKRGLQRNLDAQLDRRGSGSTSASVAQDQKVFVGGVPQELGQEDLYAIFNEFAEVKKAWLQKIRPMNSGSGATPWQNHRGFGFVIFREPDALQKLLGNDFSKFITLVNGKRLEVKRAISSSKLISPGSETGPQVLR